MAAGTQKNEPGTLATKTGAASGSYMAVAPKGDFLYAGGGTNVVAYKIDAATGALTKINPAPVLSDSLLRTERERRGRLSISA